MSLKEFISSVKCTVNRVKESISSHIRKLSKSKNDGEFGIFVEKIYEDWWRIGIFFTHDKYETYLCISLFKWVISIGKIIK